MTEEKVDNKKCPICIASQRRDDGWDLYPVSGGKAMIRCRCGLISKIFGKASEALEWWNTRGGRLEEKYKTRVTVEHPPIARRDREE